VTTGKPKTTTYMGKAAIVDGSDERTYILQKSMYGMVYVFRSDFMQEKTYSDTEPQHAVITALIDEANKI
jgi:hypothetical protein